MEINFFPIGFPKRELPFWTNSRRCDEDLPKEERLLDPANDSATRTTVFVGGDQERMPAGFAEASLDYRELPPGIVQLHIQAGLSRALRALGHRVIPIPLGLRCFAPDAELQNESVPDFIRVLRGVELRVDYVGVGTDRLIGAFVSPRSLVEFRFGLEDIAVAEAAENRRVSFTHQETFRRGRLVRVDHERSVATIESADDEMEMPLNQVRVPGDAQIVARYCERTGRVNEVGRVFAAGQIANFRFTTQGKRNRRWLARQYEYVRSWLIAGSRAGYLRFPWPRSEDQLTLDVRPTEAREAA